MEVGWLFILLLLCILAVRAPVVTVPPLTLILAGKILAPAAAFALLAILLLGILALLVGYSMAAWARSGARNSDDEELTRLSRKS